MAILPSREAASFKVTNGRPSVMYLFQASFNAEHAGERTPSMTSIPAALKAATPLPETFGLGSDAPTTTFFMPAAIMASVHGGVFPK